MYKIELSDKRNIILRQKLDATPFAFDSSQADKGCVIIFSPARKLTVFEADLIPDGTTVLGGAQGGAVLQALSKNDVTYKNLMDDQEFVLQNAVLTAEGALCLLIESTQKSIFDCNILLSGCGRVAKALARLLKRLELRVDICIFNKDKLADAAPYCNRALAAEDALLSSYDVIINTIPAPVFTAQYLKKISCDATIIELASVPCLDTEDAKNYPFKYVKGAALPAKYCPEAAAEAMKQCILRLV